jgi:nitrogen fixation/metabolism regulation signal transduction histidine kinase
MNIDFIRHHRLQIILRLGLILLFMMTGILSALAWAILPGAVLSLVGAVWQGRLLFLYIDRHNRDLIRFLEAVKYEDFQHSFSGRASLGGSEKAMYEALAEVFTLFRRNREKGEQQHRYLQAIVEHIDIGLLSVRTDGRLDLINRAARNLLKVGHLNVVSDLSALFNPEFVHTLETIQHGQKQTVAVEGKKNRFSALLYATNLRVGDHLLKLISIQNIDKVLEEKELQAWQSLIKVLTHEIMNSMTPIASLSDTAAKLMSQVDLAEHESLADVYDALQTIRSRSVGLMDFVKAYRNLTLIPRPTFTLIRVDELFERVRALLERRLAGNGIDLVCGVDPVSLSLTADPSLIEQVLLNLLINAIDAVSGLTEPCIRLNACMDENGRTVIRVRDNGCGIAESARDKIFIPFFSTKETGSGIGLSFSRQIMRLHQGYLELAPTTERGSTFVMTF